MAFEPLVSFVLATHNRRETLSATLVHLHDLALPAEDHEIIVVDNASSDGTAAEVCRRFPRVRLLGLPSNLGSCAKALGVDEARGRYVVFLDDDSWPRPGSIERLIAHFDDDDRLGAAGFHVQLPDGRSECSAFPDVFVGCGVGFRRAVLAEVGGLDRTLFMQAEEYDLSFRLVNAGWRVRTFADLHVEHAKTPHARLSERTVYYDTRNNLLLAARYLSDPLAKVYSADWEQRYHWIAESSAHVAAWQRGVADARERADLERPEYADRRLSPQAFERLFRLNFVARRMWRLRETGARRVALAGLGKNLYPFVRAARDLGLNVPCIADNRFADADRSYRGVPVRPIAAALSVRLDAVVVSDTSPVHAENTEQRWRARTNVPIHRWFGFDLEPTERLAAGGRAEPLACAAGVQA